MKQSILLRSTISLGGIVVGALLAAGCSAEGNTEPVQSTEQKAIGDFLPGIQASAGVLDEATEVFGDFESINDGVGPIFNAQACGQCHSNSATGGAGEQIERRFGRFDNGVFN